MIICEKPLAMDGAEGRRWSRRSRRPTCRTWSGTTTAASRPSPRQAAHRRGRLARSSTTAPTSCRTGPSPPTCRRAARASGGSTSRPPAAASPATCSPTASTPRSGSTAASTNVSAMTETFIKERKHNLTGKVEKVGIDDACAFLCPVRERLARPVRIDPLRPRPQGALHLRDQRRARLDQVGPARPAPPAILRPPRRGHRARLAVDPRHRRRPPPPHQGANTFIPSRRPSPGSASLWNSMFIAAKTLRNWRSVGSRRIFGVPVVNGDHLAGMHPAANAATPTSVRNGAITGMMSTSTPADRAAADPPRSRHS